MAAQAELWHCNCLRCVRQKPLPGLALYWLCIGLPLPDNMPSSLFSADASFTVVMPANAAAHAAIKHSRCHAQVECS
jgi:hypothetical protein